jgi:hypothetical protein
MLRSGLMDHQTLLELEKEIGERPGFCNMCYKWVGNSKLRTFMGKDVCFTCYKNFKLFIEDMNTNDAILWFFRRINAQVDIKFINKSETVIKVKNMM